MLTRTIEDYPIENKKVCLIDPNHKTYVTKKGLTQWYRYKDGWICLRCRNKLISNPKRLKFIDKQIVINKKIRTYRCLLCGKKKGDKYVNYRGKIKVVSRITIHHIRYHNDDPTKDIVELCQSCHNRESWLLRKNHD